MKVKNLRRVAKARKAIWDDDPTISNCTIYCVSVAILTTIGIILLAA